MERKETLHQLAIESFDLTRDLFDFGRKKEPTESEKQYIMAMVRVRLELMNKLYKHVEEVFPW